MKDFKNFGIRVRKNLSNNYWAWWYNLDTVRMDIGETTPLSPERPEFMDIGIGTKCNLNCPFCYTNASSGGVFWQNISETWKKWMDTFPSDQFLTPETDDILKDILSVPTPEDVKDDYVMAVKTVTRMNKSSITLTEKPLTIAVGSTGEPTIHPEFSEFLETVYRTNVVPSYTTNGVLLSDYNKSRQIFEATANFCGGVAVSYGNKDARNYADKAIYNLLKYGDTKIKLHHIISDKESVDDFIKVAVRYRNDIHTHVLLPMMAHGRSKTGMTSEVYPYLVSESEKAGIKNIALGANFRKFLLDYPGLFETWELPGEIYSKNALLKNGKVVITPSSFNLNPVKIIDL